MPIAEMSAGFLTGLLFGAAIGIFRPLVLLAAIGVAAALFVTGVSGLLDLFGRAANELGHHAVFFASLAVGKLVAAVMVLR